MWLLVALVGYLLNAVALTIDKALLSKAIPKPADFTFMMATLGMLVVVLLPFGVTLVPGKILALSWAAGVFFVVAILAMFTALQHSEASKIAPFIGGVQPLFVFLFASLLLGEQLANSSLWGFALVVLGGLVLSIHKARHHQHALLLALLATIAFALSYTITKAIFNETTFLNGLFWTRLGAFLAALTLLFSPETRHALLQVVRGKKAQAGRFFLLGQAAGALSFVLINYAFSLHSVTLVNALQGSQYVFLFLLVVPLSYFYPRLWQENLRYSALLQKILAIVFIGSGLYFLA